MTEREVYQKMWTTGYKRSQCAVPLVELVKKHIKAGEKAIEIGSGDGTTIRGLEAIGIKATGTDIYSTNSSIIECPADNIPFGDDFFDVSFSTDVLEHIPTSLVDDSIREILRVTSRLSIHVIACWGDERDGIVLHKTVQKIAWWKDKFNSLNTENKELVIIDRDAFL